MSLQLQPFTQADLAQNPRIRDVMQLLGDGKIETAIADLKIQAAQELAGAAFLLAAVYYKEQRYSDAVAHLKSSRELSTHSPAWTLTGAAHLKLGNNGDAYRSFKYALRHDCQNYQAHRLAWSAIKALGMGRQAHKIARDLIIKHHSQPKAFPAARRINLSQVTLCAVDCVDPAMAARALRISASMCQFGAVKLLTSKPYQCDGIVTTAIPHIASIEAYSEFVIRELHRHIETEFVLLIQWDGHVLTPDAWSDQFLLYDYIGARWILEHLEPNRPGPPYVVGNGGFSLRSRKFLESVASMCEKLPPEQLHPEDGVACRLLRPELEKTAAIRFAPPEIADQFSVEHSITNQPTFGFHGDINMAYAIQDPAFTRLDFLDDLLEI